jgi:hypothetical protein
LLAAIRTAHAVRGDCTHGQKHNSFAWEDAMGKRKCKGDIHLSEFGERPRNWLTELNRPQTPAEKAIDNAVKRMCPLIDRHWMQQHVRQYDPAHAIHHCGRQPC